MGKGIGCDDSVRLSLKEQIDRIGRMKISKISGISYSYMSSLLNGFAKMSQDDVKIFESAIKAAGNNTPDLPV